VSTPLGTLDRGLAILDYLASAREASATEIAGALTLSRSTTYRLIDRLDQAGYVDAAASGRWRLGAAAARLAMAAVHSTDVVHAAPDLLRSLAQQTRETVGLGVFSADEMIFVYRERGPQPVTLNAEVGARRPLHCTAVGKAYLAALPPDECRALLRRIKLVRHTPNTITSRTSLEAELEEIRRRGWSLERREFTAAAACCGAAVLDPGGRPAGAISADGPADRIERALDRIAPIVASTAEAISRRLGYAPELDPRRR
jgi:IclR family transcriptional regulator, acetate operon repressor